MVTCNTCGFVGSWYGKVIVDQNGEKHECLKGKIFTYHGLQYPKTDDEIDPTAPRQYRIEGKTWTLYHYGELFKVLPMGGSKK